MAYNEMLKAMQEYAQDFTKKYADGTETAPRTLSGEIDSDRLEYNKTYVDTKNGTKFFVDYSGRLNFKLTNDLIK